MSAHSAMGLLTVMLKHEHDVVLARQRARQVAGLLRFGVQEQTRIATAVSEIARNAYAYAGGGKVEFAIVGTNPPQALVVHVSDQGPGIPMLQRILDGQYVSSTGTGTGLLGARRLVDQCDIQTSTAGTTVMLKKVLPPTQAVITSARLAQIAAALAQQGLAGPLAVIQQQNQELLQTLGDLRQKQDDLQRLNCELADMNRGMASLYAELEERAEHLRHANAMKTRFLSYTTHELRVPIHSILAISGLLLDRLDGDLGAEQEKQVTFIRRAAEDLIALVNDLLDLAKIEAGKITVQRQRFEVPALFGALRSILRPVAHSHGVELVFEEPEPVPPLVTDESKVSQILRNLISNALKFTAGGEVRVSAVLTPDATAVRFAVADTGIGIAPEHHGRIFEEFVQVEHDLQGQVKGTGLGLPLCKQLATLLGGHIAVQSTPGQGAIFAVVIPLYYPSSEEVYLPEIETRQERPDHIESAGTDSD